MPPSPIQFHTVDVDLPIRDVGGLNHWLHQVAEAEGYFIGRLHYHFCSDEHLLRINQAHLDHDYLTDIITFDLSRSPLLQGDAFISVERVKDNANQLNLSFHVELMRIIVHGLLHLMGYGDKTEKEALIMRDKEKSALKLLH